MAQKETTGKPQLSYLTEEFAFVLAKGIARYLSQKRGHSNVDEAIMHVLKFTETGASMEHLRMAAAAVCLCFPMNDKETDSIFGIIPEQALVSYAAVREFGAKKYARSNWKKGIRFTLTLDAILRHLFAYARGQTEDPESGQSHFGHVLCDLEHILYFAGEKAAALDDR